MKTAYARVAANGLNPHLQMAGFIPGRAGCDGYSPTTTLAAPPDERKGLFQVIDAGGKAGTPGLEARPLGCPLNFFRERIEKLRTKGREEFRAAP